VSSCLCKPCDRCSSQYIDFAKASCCYSERKESIDLYSRVKKDSIYILKIVCYIQTLNESADMALNQLSGVLSAGDNRVDVSLSIFLETNSRVLDLETSLCLLAAFHALVKHLE
jgi:hypothetical protein